MDKNTIRELLARYMDGETTLAEERVLKGYFTTVAQDALPADMAWAHGLFGYFGAAAAEKTEKEFVGQAVNEAPVAPERRSGRRARGIWVWAGSAVAAAVVAAVLFVSPWGNPAGDVIYCYINGEPVTDFELAYAYTQGVFGLFEDNVKHAGEALFPIEEIGYSLERVRGLELLRHFTVNE